MKIYFNSRRYYWYYFFNWTGPPRQTALIFNGRGGIETHGLSYFKRR